MSSKNNKSNVDMHSNFSKEEFYSTDQTLTNNENTSIKQLDENYSDLNSLVAILRYRSTNQPDKLAYTFLEDGEGKEINLTYGQLDRQALIIAGFLQNEGLKGERALLIFPPGLEFVTAFFGCLYAGTIAVPAYPPRPNRSMERLAAIVEDAGAKVVLTTSFIRFGLSSSLLNEDKLSSLRWLAVDELEVSYAEKWKAPEIDKETLAFLQYTSGSTGNPKGVMVSHSNLIHNQKIIQEAFNHNDKSVGVIWLPPYHDMGLIGGIIQPLYVGFPVVLLSPLHFLQKPIRWLQAISNYKGTSSGGPNFAYDLCLGKIKAEQLEGLDLSSWKIAFNGAEPVKAETLENFSKYFNQHGFNASVFYPCYGMAETTLFVSGGAYHEPPVITEVLETDLLDNRVTLAEVGALGVRKLVGCGQGFLGTIIKIVHPETKRPCEDQEVGEIWVASDSVAQGYWQQKELTEITFRACTNEIKDNLFLRTGDLGFTLNNELYVTGRLKDVIIISGRNHYPTDIELTVQKSHIAIAPNRVAAFAIQVKGNEKLVVVAEVDRRYHRDLLKFKTHNDQAEIAGDGISKEVSEKLNEMISNIKEAISSYHGLRPHAIALVKSGSIPKTSSGKIRRFACRNDFSQEKLDLIGGDGL